MAISGAALNPNAGPGGQGITRQPVLSVLMGLLNLRLGYWVRNPKRAPGADAKPMPDGGAVRRTEWVKPNPIFPGLLESFGRFDLNEYARYLLLTDGGHFENLGLYELVRRRLKLIVVCDATADPDFKFTDLANAIQKVRADFGGIIDIDAEQLATLAPRRREDANTASAQPPVAARGCLIVPIRYSVGLVDEPDGTATAPAHDKGKDADHQTGTLILLKATAFKGMSADLYSYRREHPTFPNQGTEDQFFDERQFDAYRELGYMTTYRMLTELRDSAGTSLVETYKTSRGYHAQTDYAVARLLFGSV